MTAHDTLNARARLRELGLNAKKSWGQHFLHDRQVLADIVAAADVASGQAVLELGAGLGALTEALLAAGLRVTAVERDRDLAPLLVPQLMPHAPAGAHLEVVEADAARLDYAALAQNSGGPLRVLGNLPYQISSRIMVSLAEAGPAVSQATLLIQREVAERLAAPAGSRAYGLLSVLVQRRFAVRLVRRVPAGAFSPPPKVESAVVHLTGHGEIPWQALAEEAGLDAQTLETYLTRTARAAFAARRKQLANALAQGLGCRAAQTQRAIEACGIAASVRAETLGLLQFAALGVALWRDGLFAERSSEA